jgi:subtilisin family serine protease
LASFFGLNALAQRYKNCSSILPNATAMEGQLASKKRYVVLPGKGISGSAMQASIFHKKSGISDIARMVAAGAELATMMTAKLSPFAFAANTSILAASPASAELASGIGERDFEVVSQRFSDGPAVVAMTETARLAFEASHPDLRVLPVTEYHLPGTRRRRQGAKPANLPAGQSAIGADGKIFVDDLKQRVLAGAADNGGGAGKGVMVGVVDTGIDNEHPGLKKSVTLRRCYIPGAESAVGPVDWGPAFLDRAGHGTHVAGIIAAQAGHGGPAGVAPEAEVISYRVFPDTGDGLKGAENAVIIDSIRAAVEDGCHIVNLSIEGARLKEDGVRSAIADAWEQGVVCIAAAGNGFGNPVSYPAALPHCIAVTAIGRDGSFPPQAEFQEHVSSHRSQVDPEIFLALFSNYGPRVQFTAPGHAIVSTFPANQWWFFSGTSMAAPFISGMLAQLLSNNANVLKMMGSAERSAAMLQMLVGRAKTLKLPQTAQEGYGLPA